MAAVSGCRAARQRGSAAARQRGSAVWTMDTIGADATGRGCQIHLVFDSDWIAMLADDRRDRLRVPSRAHRPRREPAVETAQDEAPRAWLVATNRAREDAESAAITPLENGY